MCDHTIHANRKKTDPLCRARKRVPRRSRFWRWVIDHELLTAGESLSAPCFAAIKRPAINILPVRYKLQRDILSKNQNLLDGLPFALSTELKCKAARRETCSVPIDLLEQVGMVLTAWVMHELVGDRSESIGEPILMRGDNLAAVT